MSKIITKTGIFDRNTKISSNDHQYFGTLNEREKKFSMNTNLRKSHFLKNK
jgi:hypothetical protein